MPESFLLLHREIWDDKIMAMNAKKPIATAVATTLIGMALVPAVEGIPCRETESNRKAESAQPCRAERPHSEARTGEETRGAMPKVLAFNFTVVASGTSISLADSAPDILLAWDGDRPVAAYIRRG